MTCKICMSYQTYRSKEILVFYKNKNLGLVLKTKVPWQMVVHLYSSITLALNLWREKYVPLSPHQHQSHLFKMLHQHFSQWRSCNGSSTTWRLVTHAERILSLPPFLKTLALRGGSLLHTFYTCLLTTVPHDWISLEYNSYSKGKVKTNMI